MDFHGIITRGQPNHIHLTALEPDRSTVALGPASSVPTECLLQTQMVGSPETQWNQNLYFNKLPSDWYAHLSLRSAAWSTQISATFLLRMAWHFLSGTQSQSLLCSLSHLYSVPPCFPVVIVHFHFYPTTGGIYTWKSRTEVDFKAYPANPTAAQLLPSASTF